MTRGLSMKELSDMLLEATRRCSEAVGIQAWEDAAQQAQLASSYASRLLTRARLVVELRERGDI